MTAGAPAAVVAMRHVMCLFSVTFYEKATGRSLLRRKNIEEKRVAKLEFDQVLWFMI